MKKQAAAQVTESWGDAAVSGLLSGILAGAVMAGFLVAAGFAGGGSVADVLSRFGTGEGTSPISGLLTHLAVSGVYGIGWGYLLRIVRRLIAAPAWLVGLAYGLLLFLLAQGVFLVGPTLLTGIPPLQFVIGHAIYGLVLGMQARKGR
ncbi:MAG: hypothetical protein DWI57_10970 [Chloroflexi bacterium]|nr:MAG: hypothetical protein DWI57_10970 [Chloroflexota bacterium]